MKNIEKYPDEILSLLDREGFIDAVWIEKLQSKCSLHKAFNVVEALSYQYFDRCRYSEFESFKKVANRQLKKGNNVPQKV
jgi:hypothetical protein